jgi:ketosteroid isomerase-like protein
MSDLHAIADRIEIEALPGEFTDAGMMRDYDRFASLFTRDAAWRMPHVNQEFVGRDEIVPRSSGCRLSGTTSCRPRTRARSSWRATPPSADHS